ncbi:hypothetical protein PV783_13560 [Chitinophaga sp. CC14]|uniref:hypothetical protein n=1 Tax=Chitinophaga sp. CC14 TaxID=3029199 RepID=UPI003B7F4405
MHYFMYRRAMLAMCVILFFDHHSLLGQQIPSVIISPTYDSILVSQVEASQNPFNGGVVIHLKFLNQYTKKIKLHFNIGGYEGLGLKDDKGVKYKIFTNSDAVGTNGINDGFKPVAAVKFGASAFKYFTYVEQDLVSKEEKTFTIQLDKVDKKVQSIKALYLRCILSIDYGQVGDKTYMIENIPVTRK